MRMKCATCGGELRRTMTDLPFKVSDTSIVILKGLPVIQCPRCPEYLIDDEVLRRVDEILAKVKGATELEIVRYAA
jgi:YgiT-type zinc finger domain-containing protein